MKNLPLACVALVFGSMMIAGCSSNAAPRDLMAEEAHAEATERPVAMKGEGSFAGGNVQVVATVARGFRRGASGKSGAAPRLRKGWFNHDTDAFNENYSFDYGESEEEQKEAIKEYVRQAMARRAAGSPMPPVTLHVTFENRGTTPVELVPTEVNSDLGNFAPRPKSLTVAPGEKASLEPMISQLGVTNDEIPLTLSIKSNGKTETQVIVVKNVLAPSLRK
jgi:hypothetical protein